MLVAIINRVSVTNLDADITPISHDGPLPMYWGAAQGGGCGETTLLCPTVFYLL